LDPILPRRGLHFGDVCLQHSALLSGSQAQRLSQVGEALVEPPLLGRDLGEHAQRSIVIRAQFAKSLYCRLGLIPALQANQVIRQRAPSLHEAAIECHCVLVGIHGCGDVPCAGVRIPQVPPQAGHVRVHLEAAPERCDRRVPVAQAGIRPAQIRPGLQRRGIQFRRSRIVLPGPLPVPPGLVQLAKQQVRLPVLGVERQRLTVLGLRRVQIPQILVGQRPLVQDARVVRAQRRGLGVCLDG